MTLDGYFKVHNLLDYALGNQNKIIMKRHTFLDINICHNNVIDLLQIILHQQHYFYVNSVSIYN